MFKWEKLSEIEYLKITDFTEHKITAIFTSRKGGISSGPYNSLNLGFHTDDSNDNILKNRKILAETLNIDYKKMTSAEQVHSNKIHIVKKEDTGKGALDYSSVINNVDGLITDIPDLPLVSFYADCVPLFFLDTENKVIGLAHAGWKGTVQKIGPRCVQKMKKEFNTSPEHLLVAIGPAISQKYFEVDEDVFLKFKSVFTDHEKFINKKNRFKYSIDLSLCNKLSLIKAEVPENNIICSNYCTYDNQEYFYSYRRDNGVTGRMVSIIQI